MSQSSDMIYTGLGGLAIAQLKNLINLISNPEIDIAVPCILGIDHFVKFENLNQQNESQWQYTSRE